MFKKVCRLLSVTVMCMMTAELYFPNLTLKTCMCTNKHTFINYRNFIFFGFSKRLKIL